jgi:hypothetical protein
MNCPEEVRKNCWAYRLNFGLECWLLRKNIRKKSSWQRRRKCNNCKFYNIICQKFNIE